VAFGPLSAGKPAVCQFYTHSGGNESLWTTAGKPHGGHMVKRPFRVDPLPTHVPAAEVLARATQVKDAFSVEAGSHSFRSVAGAPGLRTFIIGLGGDELLPVGLGVPAGAVIAVLGGHGSGKTNFLHVLRALNRGSANWLAPGARCDPCEYWSGALHEADSGIIDRRAIALVDDADLLPPSVHQDLADLNTKGISVVFTAGFSPLLIQRLPLALSARGSACGLLIAPRSVTDGDLFGVRFDVEQSPPAGRSVLITNGRPKPVQLGWLPGTIELSGAEPQTAGGEPPVRDA
jgi:S-DNA-T family DNA segregation ATPase FtsK/SpoIIIE